MKARTLVPIAVALALLVALMPTAALALEEGSASGSFTAANVDPAADAVALWTTGGTPAETTAMTPQVEYNVKVTVTDANTLDDLSTVKVTIFYDADGVYAPADVPGVGNTQTAAILTWTNATPSTWTIDAISGGGTWSIEDTNCVEPTLTGSSGTFEFHFKPGKVATETIAPAKWHIYAEADDGGGNPGSNTKQNLTMNWYGEITVNTASVDWGSIAPGANFAGSTKQTGISVTYIANGAYDEKVAASSPWTGASGNATLDATGTCANANEFALKADDTMGLASAVLVTASPTYVAIDVTGVQTAEAGDTVTTNTMWLKLATPFTDDTYSGTSYYQIADGS